MPSLVGKVFERWTVQERALQKTAHACYWCRCSCGVVRIVEGVSLTSGNSKSCGCLAKERTRDRLRGLPFSALYNHMKRLAAQRSIEFKLSFPEFLDFTKIKHCHYCSEPLTWPAFFYDKGGTKGYNLDRLNNKKGYEKDNLVACCWLCNFTRGDRFTPEEFAYIGDVMRALRPISSEDSAFIHTFSGKKWKLSCPDPADVSIVDIAHALSLMCRFNGSVKNFYSIAEHSVRVSLKCSPKNALWALLHDAAEFATEDMNRPLKYSPGMRIYRMYEKRTQDAIMKHFGLPLEEPEEVKILDRRMLVTEQRDLTAGGISSGNQESIAEIPPFEEKIWPWSPEHAEGAFLARYRALTKDVDISFPFGYLSPACRPDKTPATTKDAGFQKPSSQPVRQPEPLTEYSRPTIPAKKGSCG